MIWLCPEHHAELHEEHRFDKTLKCLAETMWMRTYHKTEDDFRKRYGKSILS